MIITTYLLEKFIDIKKIAIQDICKTLDKIGLEVESCTPIKMPEKVVVGRVLEKSPHPNADKLSVCRVDVGDEILSIVCGAKNVAQDQYVAVALQGAILGDLKIKISKLRGVESFGMLCSSTELGLPKINDGIMILDESIGELVIGKSLGEYPIFSGHCLDLSLTPNRGDCLCVLGIARELKSVYGIDLKKPKEYISTNQIGIGRKMQIGIKNKIDSSLLYRVVDFKSMVNPLALTLSLAFAGKLKESVVQNFMSYTTYMTGVVLNAYGADALYKRQNHEILQLNVSKDDQGFEQVTCGGIKLSKIGVGSEVEQSLDENYCIIFEASYINPTQISQVLFESKLKEGDKNLTYLTTRGSNPDLNAAMNFLCLMLSCHCDCFIYDNAQEVKQGYEPNIIHTRFSNLTEIIGYEINRDEAFRILKQLGFLIEIKGNTTDSFSIISPHYRHDIQNEQDLSEEILRIYGIEKIPAKPYVGAEKSKMTSSYLSYKNQRNLILRALGLGFLESIHYLFYQRSRLLALGFEVLDEALDLINPITLELDTLRTSLLPAMLDSLVRNHNRGYKNIKLCEAGSVYDSQRQEREHFAFVVSGLRQEELYPHPKGLKWDLYSFAREIAQIIGHFDLESFDKDARLPAIFHPYQSAKVIYQGRNIGILAKIHPNTARAMDLQDVFLCELDARALEIPAYTFKNYSLLPKSYRDLTLLTSSHLEFKTLQKALNAQNIKYLSRVYPLDLFIQPDGQMALSIRLEITPSERTLMEEEIHAVSLQVLEVAQGMGLKLKV